MVHGRDEAHSMDSRTAPHPAGVLEEGYVGDVGVPPSMAGNGLHSGTVA